MEVNMEEHKCPKCNSTDVKRRELSKNVMVINKLNTFYSSGTAVEVDVCIDCGYFIDFWARKPEKLR